MSTSSLGPGVELSTVQRVRRILYVLEDDIDSRYGPIEITYSNREVELYDAAGDGEELRVDREVWKDPFEGELSTENQQWVANHGKWTAFDVSEEAPYVDIVGKSVTRTNDICLDDGKIIGRVLHVGKCELRIEVGPDELVVTVF